MRKLIVIVSICCIGMVSFRVYGEEVGKEKAKKARISLGLDLADTTIAFFERDGVHIPVSIGVGYDFTDNFQAYSSQIIRFPLRGGYIYTPSIGLRVHSKSIYGLTFFLGADIGYELTNVVWFKNGFIMRTHVGTRYIFRFNMYIEGGAGGNFAISANEIRPSYFLILGYIM